MGSDGVVGNVHPHLESLYALICSNSNNDINLSDAVHEPYSCTIEIKTQL